MGLVPILNTISALLLGCLALGITTGHCQDQDPSHCPNLYSDHKPLLAGIKTAVEIEDEILTQMSTAGSKARVDRLVELILHEMRSAHSTKTFTLIAMTSFRGIGRMPSDMGERFGRKLCQEIELLLRGPLNLGLSPAQLLLIEKEIAPYSTKAQR